MSDLKFEHIVTKDTEILNLIWFLIQKISTLILKNVSGT